MTTLSSLQPYQQELLKRLGMLEMDYRAKKRFQVVQGLMTMSPDGKYDNGVGNYGLMIEDYVWWMDNERDILNWITDHLPKGIEHQQGMILLFPTDEDRVLFLLRWGG